MDQHQNPLPAPPGQILHVVSRPAGVAQAIGFVVGIFLFGVVFATGLAIGAVIVAASTMFETGAYQEVYRDGDATTVVIIPVDGVIDAHRAYVVRNLVDQALGDRSTKAAVLRVNSPGGGIAASDQIWYQVKRMRDAGIPVIASFGGLAASGGYYISCGTDHIVAEPTCITGSIGVIAQAFIFKNLLDKVGIEPVTLLATDSPEKDVGNPMRAWTDKDRRTYIDMLDAAYDIFNGRVKEGRKVAIEDPALVDKLADGSIFTAAEARDNGLVDTIGYLDDAIAQAERSAGLPAGRSTVVILREPTSPLDELLGGRTPTPGPGALFDAQKLRGVVNDLSLPRVMYLMR